MKTKNLLTTMLLFVVVFLSACKKDDFVETKTLCPEVVSTNPANGSAGVDVTQNITVRFNTDLDPQSVNSQAFSLTARNNGNNAMSTIAGTVTYDAANKTLVFNPTADLPANSTFTGRVETSIKDPNGNRLQQVFTWTFSTNMPPFVQSTDPANNATNVALNKVIEVIFSQPMNPTTINNSTFSIRAGSNTVAGTIVFANNRLLFTPSANLAANTVYTGTVTTGAKSISNISMASNFTWTFTTASSVSPTPNMLGTVERFGIFAATGITNIAGFSEIINLDVGITPGARSSITGFPPGQVVGGAIFASDDLTPVGTAAMLNQAKNDLTNAYLALESNTSTTPFLVSGDMGGRTITPGIYKSNSSLMIQNGSLTLNGQGDINAVWIFQIGSSFTTVGGAGGNIILTNGAQAKNIYWQVGSSATIGDNTLFSGNILALTSITMNSNARATGRMLVRNGAVTLTSTNIITRP